MSKILYFLLPCTNSTFPRFAQVSRKSEHLPLSLNINVSFNKRHPVESTGAHLALNKSGKNYCRKILWHYHQIFIKKKYWCFFSGFNSNSFTSCMKKKTKTNNNNTDLFVKLKSRSFIRGKFEVELKNNVNLGLLKAIYNKIVW